MDSNSFAQEYVINLEERHMRENALNKLNVKKNLISEAIGKKKPKKARFYIIQYLKYLQKYHSVLELPESDSFATTRQMVKIRQAHPFSRIDKRDLILKKRDSQPYFNESNSHSSKII